MTEPLHYIIGVLRFIFGIVVQILEENKDGKHPDYNSFEALWYLNKIQFNVGASHIKISS